MYYDLKDYELYIFYSDDDEGFIATILEIPTLSGFGGSPEKSIEELKTAFALAKEVYEEDKKDMPEPLNMKKYSGQFRIRIPKDLHYEIAKTACLQQVSINQTVNYLLSKGIGEIYHKSTT